tara:strand:- start:1933 stop:3828 length:1896 start_codon:yes stop_codon:yes gene_type:complete
MAYQVNKTDGTIVATVADGQIDTLSTDLTLIGKNYSGFGESLNENFVKLLENFSSTTQPSNPIKGQIWFDGTENKLKVYSGTAFVPVSSATISNTQPTTLGVGDLWFNDTDKQLYFFDGANIILLGPDYSQLQGLSGTKVTSVLDSLNQTRVITSLYNNGILLGIFSKDSFTPKNAIEGFTGSINPGFNQGTLANMKFDVTATNAEKLGNVDATTYARRDTSNQFAGQVRINSDLGIVFGAGDQGNITVTDGNLFFSNTASDKGITFNVRKGIVQEEAMKIDASNRKLSVFENFTSSEAVFGGSVEIKGNTTIRGQLTIEDGDITALNTQNLIVENKQIELANTGDTATNSDTVADGGGIVLKGPAASVDHVLLWSNLGLASTSRTPALAAQAWTSSEHINLATGKAFKINGVTVLNGTSLGTGITAIPGVTSFGTQNVVNIGASPPTADFKLETDSGSSKPRITTLTTDSDLEIAPNGTGNLALIGSPKITGLADPTGAQDAASKEYVDNTIETRSLAFSMDLSDGKPNSYISGTILTQLAPPADFRNGSLARILCTTLQNSTTSLEINPLRSETRDDFNLTSGGSASALQQMAFNTATVAAPAVTTLRVIKTFQLVAGAWSFVSEVSLP